MNPKRKAWFKVYAGMLKASKKESHFIYLDKEFSDGAVILSNHVGTAGPLSFELFLDKPTRFWGAHEMNDTLGSMYKYQSEVFYHEKRGWNLTLSRLFCLMALRVAAFSALVIFFSTSASVLSASGLPVIIKSAKIFVSAKSPVIVQELSLYKQKLLKRLRHREWLILAKIYFCELTRKIKQRM